eukprot:GHVL01014824.1.p1 GENE.GHVL01014824.1~~GHVL01014824.1.p1  ORF type:complete len:849 (+),score=188.82 GHVL01014824.1:579-3125(+)
MNHNLSNDVFVSPLYCHNHQEGGNVAYVNNVNGGLELRKISKILDHRKSRTRRPFPDGREYSWSFLVLFEEEDEKLWVPLVNLNKSSKILNYYLNCNNLLGFLRSEKCTSSNQLLIGGGRIGASPNGTSPNGLIDERTTDSTDVVINDQTRDPRRLSFREASRPVHTDACVREEILPVKIETPEPLGVETAVRMVLDHKFISGQGWMYLLWFQGDDIPPPPEAHDDDFTNSLEDKDDEQPELVNTELLDSETVKSIDDHRITDSGKLQFLVVINEGRGEWVNGSCLGKCKDVLESYKEKCLTYQSEKTNSEESGIKRQRSWDESQEIDEVDGDIERVVQHKRVGKNHQFLVLLSNNKTKWISRNVMNGYPRQLDTYMEFLTDELSDCEETVERDVTESAIKKQNKENERSEEVHSIVDHRKMGRGWQFLVCFKNKPRCETMWVTRKSILSENPEILQEYISSCELPDTYFGEDDRVIDVNDVKQIIDTRKHGRSSQILIRLRNSEDPIWVSRKILRNCDQLIEDFLMERGYQENAEDSDGCNFSNFTSQKGTTLEDNGPQVDKILEHRRLGRGWHFLVLYKGKIDSPEWLPRRCLTGCSEALDSYLKAESLSREDVGFAGDEDKGHMTLQQTILDRRAQNSDDFQVRKIMNHRRMGRGWQFLVWPQGAAKCNAIWLPLKNLKCKEMLDTYLEKVGLVINKAKDEPVGNPSQSDHEGDIEIVGHRGTGPNIKYLVSKNRQSAVWLDDIGQEFIDAYFNENKSGVGKPKEDETGVTCEVKQILDHRRQGDDWFFRCVLQNGTKWLELEKLTRFRDKVSEYLQSWGLTDSDIGLTIGPQGSLIISPHKANN